MNIPAECKPSVLDESLGLTQTAFVLDKGVG